MTEKDALLKELELHTRLIAESDEAGRKLFLVLITVFGVFAGVYTSDGIISSPAARAWTLIALSQIVFVVMMKIVLEFSLQLLRVGLKRALEDRLNTMLGSNVFLWDSYVAKEHILQLKSAMARASGILWVLALLGYIVVGCLAISQFGHSWLLVIIAIEFGILLRLGILSVRDAALVQRSCAALLGASPTPRSCSGEKQTQTEGEDNGAGRGGRAGVNS